MSGGRASLLRPPHGAYRHLKSFQVTRLLYDFTIRFCTHYLPPTSRTHDQMVQAAPSSLQNIAESSTASGTSKKMEIKLTNVARASLEELRLDFEDFLRQHGLQMWPNNDPRRTDLISRCCQTAEELAAWLEQTYHAAQAAGQPVSRREIAANAALTLIDVAASLLVRQIAAQARAFEKEGGFTERLYHVIQQRRQQQKMHKNRHNGRQGQPAPPRPSNSS